MRVVTWNVNSLRTRLPRVLGLLERHAPDVVCLQETKTTDEVFPVAAFEERGYHVAAYGQPAYNGVAILSRKALDDVRHGFPGDPVPEEARALWGRAEGLTIANLYVVNGQFPQSEKYRTKMRWFEALRNHVADTFRRDDRLLLVGDFNVAPDDRDVHDPPKWEGQVHCTEDERAQVRSLMDWGLTDLLREHTAAAGIHTWWDYRMGAFARGWGLRIDLALGSRPVADACTAVTVDRDERKQGDWDAKPSDHAPVIVDLAD